MDTTIEPFSLPRRADTPSPSTKTPSKNRSFSDPPNTNTPSTLAPSPTFREKTSLLQTRDDHALPTTPQPRPAGRRPDFARGLSLQMPGSQSQSPKLFSNMPAPSHFPPQPRGATPLSPQLDQHNIYMQQQQQQQQGSPATSLPRHSRGLDWSRACTNLHHSTVLDTRSPLDVSSSPVMAQKEKEKGGWNIPSAGSLGRSRRGSVMMLDSPTTGNGMASSTTPWGLLAPERSAMSSSVGSVNMLASESESTDSDEDASMGGDDNENEDAIFTTPQVHKLQNPNAAATPFAGPPTTPGGGAMWGSGSHFSPAQTSRMKTIRRSRLQKHNNGQKRSRKSSSSASGSGYSSMASPRTTSPPPMRSIESASTANGGYFNWATAARSRRESLALGTDGLHLSSGNDSGDEASQQNTQPSTPGVVRRPVVRRGNLLPKTKGFARIRAALMEEAAPVDTEVRREAETIRQVRERDGSLADSLDLTHDSRPQTGTNEESSPNLLPAVPEAIQEDFALESESSGNNSNTAPKTGLGLNFATHATRNSGGMDYWNRFDPSLRTPPPPPSFPRQGSSVMSIDIDTLPSSDIGNSTTPLWRRPRARSSASDASEAFISSGVPPTAGAAGGGINDDMHLKKFKRRREDDFDIATIKRRAVSPGMSAQNSPVLTHSPTQKEVSAASGAAMNGGNEWGQPPERPLSQSQGQGLPLSAGSDIALPLQPVNSNGSRHGSGGSGVSIAAPGTLTPAGKKLGLQGMVDTHDGLMKMSIE